ncbi:MAG TPA: hypothetical protein PLH91_04370 [Tenuifilaceae bacterium]|nr:hypothetical protein [Tenuifilaceae bacterium]HOZ13670.1 hypothetical protein [Tenuifilaceae bacterium]HPI44446.1 hypothetical protein [Tenuifilaceae bacterium]HPN20376.1 hypothetical protein [Tenuifilaceae bacterium]HPV56788.1 hypothetical protein [Tenuifilaceae bacterium]
MNSAEIKLDLFRRIDSIKESDLEKIYIDFLKLLNARLPYKLSNDEKAAIDEALEASQKGESFSHEEVIDEAKRKFPTLNFK